MQSCHRITANLCRLRIFGMKHNPSVVRFFTTDKIDTTETSGKSEEFNENKETVEPKVELSGFAKAFAKFSEAEPPKKEEVQTFANLLRHSNFVDLGDPEGKIVPGRIFHVVGDDLYIDFGWKFHCVCTRPMKNAESYVRGALVRVRIKDLELSTRFLGATKDLTILEADCVLTSLISTPMKNVAVEAVE
ncbi:28S ribosomal protein S28, mitochondrial [Venturia canescens]|uniref:28S ribosomal protein S28, mitochondrial n=1 Tax=Venturia canescens TaxID=32260 RepID=UPI001C9BEC5C|nr:28S ribosomal protein S28, mitochondrial [Venturia canescens]